MKLDLLDIAFATGTFAVPMLAQAAGIDPTSLIGVASNLSGYGLAVLLVIYNKFYELPRWEKDRREERAEILTAHKIERAEIITNFQKQMDEKRKDYLADVAQAREEFLQQLSQERDAFKAMLEQFRVKA